MNKHKRSEPVAGKKILGMLNFELRNHDPETRSFTAIASDDSIDRYGTIIDQNGWDIANFLSNPVIPWGHDYSQPPVATSLETGVVNGVLTIKPTFATVEELSSDPTNPSEWAKFADTIYKLYTHPKRFLRAFSVGFIPKAWHWDKTEDDGAVLVYDACELLEVSAVTVPANPNALAKAFELGVIDAEEARSLLSMCSRQIESIELLTKSIEHKDNSGEDIDMTKYEELKSLLEENKSALDAGLEAVRSEMNSRVDALETDVNARLADIDGKLESRSEDPDGSSDEDVTPPADDTNQDGDADGSDSVDSDDEDEALTDEEREIVKDEAKKAFQAVTGKVD